MTESALQTFQVVLCDEVFAGRISVKLEPFVQFNAAMETALSSLVEKWRFHAPPQTQRGPVKRSRNRHRE